MKAIKVDDLWHILSRSYHEAWRRVWKNWRTRTSGDCRYGCRFPRDAEAWCQTTGNRFVSVKSGAGKYEVIVEKSTPQSSSSEVCREDKGKTFILFSDNLDKVLATFVLANGAAATGKKVIIFFTFWGLNAIKRLDKPAVKKDIWGKMFGMMLLPVL